ncbi:MAG: hypothetical protein EZS28_025227 [Streblomastix strix]|uniref:TmcB/TmcC TPR repeats domain-containing protein n=1 Tax=Streblomastix strix TaxID=222440 RepID=A0A5J4V9P9_9EUKA|nr:MAG: hypothetical protein EZS28_025227 [Streblomastix strix]
MPSMAWLSASFLYDFDSKGDDIHLDMNPSLQAWSVAHTLLFVFAIIMVIVICGIQAFYNYFCCPTNPKGGGLFSRDTGFWGIIISSLEISQVVVNYVISYYGAWRRPFLFKRTEVPRDVEYFENKQKEDKEKMDKMEEERKMKKNLIMQIIIIEIGKNLMQFDVLPPKELLFNRPYIPKIRKSEALEPSIRFIYQKKYRNPRYLSYVNVIFRSNYSNFKEDSKLSIYVNSKEWEAATAHATSGMDYVFALSQHQLNETLPIAQGYYEEARKALREFWDNLQRPQPDFTQVNKILSRIDKNKTQAKKKYQILLQEFQQEPKVNRGYADLLRNVFRRDEDAQTYINKAIV